MLKEFQTSNYSGIIPESIFSRTNVFRPNVKLDMITLRRRVVASKKASKSKLSSTNVNQTSDKSDSHHPTTASQTQSNERERTNHSTADAHARKAQQVRCVTMCYSILDSKASISLYRNSSFMYWLCISL